MKELIIFGEKSLVVLKSKIEKVLMAFVILVAVLLNSAISSDVDVSPSSRSQFDFLEALQVWNSSYQGLTLIPGLRPYSPAIFLEGDSRDIRVPDNIKERAASLLPLSKDFTLMATLQQEEKNAGTILSFSKGNQRYFEFQSSGRRNELRFQYVFQGSVRVETFPVKLADQTWHKVALMVSGNQIEVWVDCSRLYRRLIPPPFTNFTKLSNLNLFPDSNEDFLPNSSQLRDQQLSLYVGQRNSRHFLFKGAMQDVRLIVGPSGHLIQCPQADAECPTCGKFQQLNSQVMELQDVVSQLTARLRASEEKLEAFQQCDCLRSCRVNGTLRQDGATWKSGCEICSCVHGEVLCRPVPCIQSPCKNPVYTEGECCPKCLKQCSYNGVIYDHGETVSPKQCLTCECVDGSMKCTHVDPKIACPVLQCPEDQQFSQPDECCKHCPGVDYCKQGHACHSNATCINLHTTYTCRCNSGFQGDGKRCSDCAVKGVLRKEGELWTPGHSDCSQCLCSEGKVFCEKFLCDCNHPNADLSCCPQCDSRLSCQHQELEHVTFQSGQRWSYQCQTCECLYGEIDCWPLDCPQALCQSPSHNPGECCPRCLEDPCYMLDGSLGNETNSVTKPCQFQGLIYASGQEWASLNDDCIECRCQDGLTCCHFRSSCFLDRDEPTTGGNYSSQRIYISSQNVVNLESLQHKHPKFKNKNSSDFRPVQTHPSQSFSQRYSRDNLDNKTILSASAFNFSQEKGKVLDKPQRVPSNFSLHPKYKQIYINNFRRQNFSLSQFQTTKTTGVWTPP